MLLPLLSRLEQQRQAQRRLLALLVRALWQPVVLLLQLVLLLQWRVQQPRQLVLEPQWLVVLLQRRLEVALLRLVRALRLRVLRPQVQEPRQLVRVRVSSLELVR